MVMDFVMTYIIGTQSAWGLISIVLTLFCATGLSAWKGVIYSNSIRYFQCDALKKNTFSRNDCIGSYLSFSPLQRLSFHVLYCWIPVVVWLFYALFFKFLWLKRFKIKKYSHASSWWDLHIDSIYRLFIFLTLLLYMSCITVFVVSYKTFYVKSKYLCPVKKSVTTICTDPMTNERHVTNILGVLYNVGLLVLGLVNFCLCCKNVKRITGGQGEVCTRCKDFLQNIETETSSTNVTELNAKDHTSENATNGNNYDANSSNKDLVDQGEREPLLPERVTVQVSSGYSSRDELKIPIWRLKSKLAADLCSYLDTAQPDGGWERLGTLFGINRAKLHLILDGGDAHRHFFNVLSSEQPDITLNNVKDKLEGGTKCNKKIFFLIAEKGGEKPDFNKPLSEILDNATEGEFVMQNIADKLVESRQLFCWKDLAANLDFSREKIAKIKTYGKNQNHSPAEALLEVLGWGDNNVLVLINHLESMERNDIVGYLEEQIREGNAFESPNMKNESCTL